LRQSDYRSKSGVAESKTRHIGNIVGFHGKNGVVIVRFKKGVPGQAIGDSVELISRKKLDLVAFFRDYYFCTNPKIHLSVFFRTGSAFFEDLSGNCVFVFHL